MQPVAYEKGTVPPPAKYSDFAILTNGEQVLV
jgi:hypothetical protein